ncbi:type I restriction-modification system subunit M [Kineococcus arenarius]|uniref:type I restriction-modification system subunit M n=1 Tax=unclassified Kineococcus TaxID=2621656 RepID=UPI003D7E9094
MNKQQLAARIWESANAMRSKIEANEYKDYILGLIFYKFLSDSQEQFLLRQGMLQTELAEALTEDDRPTVDFLQNNIGYFIAYDNLYSTWLKKGNDFNVADVRDALSAFARLIGPNEQALFKGIFETLQTGLSKLGDSASAQTKAIHDLLKLIRNIPMVGREGYDVLGFIYEYLIANFAANAGKKAGEFYTPHEVSILMSRIIAKHLSGRSEIQIYDPTSGSGSLLLNIGQAVARHMGDPDRIKYFAQELKSNTYNLTRMNLVMRGIKPDNIVARNGDSLERDWPMFDEKDPTGTYAPLYVDAVVSNPPYSQHWSPVGKKADPRYARFGLAPETKADYAFLLHDLFHVKPDGIMTIVLPHGVLFRGGSEATIRKGLLEQNHIDTIIGLPAGIFFGTGIPTIIMVLKQRREHDDVLFIDASRGFLKVGKNNQLRASDIRRISDAVDHRVAVERFARVVSRDEIRENDYNLNIPRYVSATPPAEPIDLYATMFGAVPESEIDALAPYWDVMHGLREALFASTIEGYGQLVEGDLRSRIEEHSSVAAFHARVPEALAGLAELLQEKLVDGRATVRPMQAEDELTAEVFERFARVPLVDTFEAYQILHDQWAGIAVDLEMIQTEGEQAIRQVDPVMVTRTRNKVKVEVQDGWEGRVVPFALVQDLLLADEKQNVAQLATQVEMLDGELAELIGSLTEEDKLDLSAVLNEAEDAFLKTELNKAVKPLLRPGSTWADDSPEAIQIRAKKLLDGQTKGKAALKVAAAKLDAATRDAIENLTDAQVGELLQAKWIEPLVGQLETMSSAVIGQLRQRVQTLHDKYAISLVGLHEEIERNGLELASALGSLKGSDADVGGLQALQGLLGGSHE